MLIRPPVVRDLRKDLWAKMSAGDPNLQDPRMMSIPIGSRTAAGSQSGPPSETDSRLASLRQLGELRATGVLTEEEFAREKARILG